MRSFFLRLIIIIFVIWVSFLGLRPTYEWYVTFTDHEKQLANTTRKEFQDITKQIETQANFLRGALGDPAFFSVALTEKAQENNNFAFDVSYGSSTYKADLTGQKVLTVLEKANPSFKDKDSFIKTYTRFQSQLNLLTEIAKYQKIRSRVMKLGLDIAGGVRFVLGVDQERLQKILDAQYTPLLNPIRIQNSLKSKSPKMSDGELKKQTQVEISRLIKEKNDKIKDEQSKGIDEALLKISNRIDQFGVSEPVIIKGPNDTIVVELPGEKDIESAKEIFTRVGVLSFHLVNEDFMQTVPLSNKAQDGTIIDPTKDAKNLPHNSSLLYTQGVDKFGQPIDQGALAVYNKVELKGEHVKNAQVEQSQLGESVISFSLDSEGTKTFADLTTKNTNRRLAIILDNKIQSAPSIREPIIGGTGSISGSFSKKDASLLATILRSGSLPIPLKVEEERIVGPSLGQSEIMKGIHASMIALIIISLFIFIYYGIWGGFSTNIAQIINLFIILAAMAYLGATLTLPGIGAIVLTIGMSIDANVILHERIKEDLRNQFSLENSIGIGYHSAFKTILDSNLTTFIPGLVLSVIGNGPIKGFGITLMIGLIINLFTSIFVTRFIYDFLIEKCGVKYILWSKKYAKK
jgi:preprotein translocase subunit SecD